MEDMLMEQAKGSYESMLSTGMRLAERTEANGGWSEYFSGELDIEDPVKKAQTAIMLENCRRWLKSMDESTRAVTVGGYSDYLYPIIRASFPNNPLHELVSVQPQTKRVGLIFWLNYVIGRTKGIFKKGDRMFSASTGWDGRVGYTDETVSGENLGSSGTSASQSGVVEYKPVRRGTMVLDFANGGANIVVADDGNGQFILSDGTATISSSSINYETGEWAVTFSAPIVDGIILATYTFDGELSEKLPMMDIEIASSSIEAIRRAVSLRYSTEAAQDFEAEFGMSLDQIIVSSCSQGLIADSCGEVIADLWNMAGAPVSTFDVSSFVPATASLSRREFFTDLNYHLGFASGSINEATQKAEGSWFVVDANAENVLTTLGKPFFNAAPASTRKQQGCVFIGTYNDQYRVYRYIHMKNFAGASAHGNILMGYKGPDFWDSGYVWAPYQALYMSPKDQRADLSSRQAFAMRYGKKRVNTAMYRRIALT